jgi:hypothetical protein
MSGQPGPPESSEIRSLARGIRLDLVIAVCALVISSLATAASWWQTRIIRDQLSAQVWPYVSISTTLDGDTADYRVSVSNDGLGPAVIRSAAVTVDGKPMPSLISVMHEILGRNIVRRSKREDRLAISSSVPNYGSVLRVGEPYVMFDLRSRRFAKPLARGFDNRVNFRLCYCAIIPGACWTEDSESHSDPQPTSACAENPADLLHESPDEIRAVLDNSF